MINKFNWPSSVFQQKVLLAWDWIYAFAIAFRRGNMCFSESVWLFRPGVQSDITKVTLELYSFMGPAGIHLFIVKKGCFCFFSSYNFDTSGQLVMQL